MSDTENTENTERGLIDEMANILYRGTYLLNNGIGLERGWFCEAISAIQRVEKTFGSDFKKWHKTHNNSFGVSLCGKDVYKWDI